MKSKYLVFSSLVLISFIFGACDMLRSLAGRPSSRDIEVMRVELLEEQKKEQVRADSLKEVQRVEAEKKAALDSLMALPENILRTASSLKIKPEELKHAYAIVIGAFRDEANAAKSASRAEEAGYSAELLSFRGGLKAVAVCGTNDVRDILSSFNKIRTESFCPKDGWILVTE